MNSVCIIGRLTKDVDIKSTQNGNSVAQFTVAVDRRFKNADGSRTTDFISCVAWRQTAVFISSYFHKGSKIALHGEIQTRTYDDQQGVKHYVTEVVVDEADFCDSKAQAQEQAPVTAPQAPAIPQEIVVEDEAELPFEV